MLLNLQFAAVLSKTSLEQAFENYPDQKEFFQLLTNMRKMADKSRKMADICQEASNIVMKR